MLRYAWAYQGHSNAEYIAYPLQTIGMRLNRSMPSTRMNDNKVRARISRQIPKADIQTGQLYIFTQR